MEKLIQQYSQQQIARFLSFALLPYLVFGALGLFVSIYGVISLLISIPAFVFGLKLYLGYIKIGWFGLPKAKAQLVWKRTMWFNWILVGPALLGMAIAVFINLRSWDDTLKTFPFIIVPLGQIAVAVTAHHTMQNSHFLPKVLDSKIAEIGKQ